MTSCKFDSIFGRHRLRHRRKEATSFPVSSLSRGDTGNERAVGKEKEMEIARKAKYFSKGTANIFPGVKTYINKVKRKKEKEKKN